MLGVRLFSMTCLAVLAALLIAAPAGADQLTVTTWGGAYATSQKNAYGRSFEAKSGIDITWEEYRGGLEQVRAQVGGGKVVWDVVDVFAHDARAGCEAGLFEHLDEDFYDGIDGDLLIKRPNDCVGPNILWSWVTAYDARRFDGAAPHTVEDFFDLRKFPGKRAIGVYPQANLEMALVADGVAPGDVYAVLDTEEGLDRAFAKLSTLKGNLEFWSAGEEPVEMLSAGEVAMAVVYNGRVGAAALSGRDWLTPVWDGQVVEEEWFVIPKGTGNLEAAHAFLRHVSEPEQQAAQAKWVTYGPMRKSALDIIEAGEPWFNTGEPVGPHLPTTTARLNRSIISDADWWARRNDELTERFAAWRRNLAN